MTPATAAKPSPELFFSTINAYQQTACLRGAMELDLFTAIAEGNHTPEALAERCQASARGIRILCESLTVLGFLNKQGDGFHLTPDSAVFLVRNSPAYLGGTIDFLLSNEVTTPFNDVAAAVRNGATVVSDRGSMEPDHDVWVKFARSMTAMMQPMAQFIAKLPGMDASPLEVLDIAAGHGLFGIEVARANPAAKVTAVDWEKVAAVAAENAQRAGVADRYRTIGGSAFDVELGSGYDVVLLTNFLHHFNEATIVGLLKRLRESLAPGGRVVTLEFVVNEDRISPPGSAMFSLTMLVCTPGGQAYSFSELDGLFREAGFGGSQLHETVVPMSRVVVTERDA